MSADGVIAKAHTELVDNLGLALKGDLDLSSQLDDRLAQLGARFTSLVGQLSQLDPDGGFAKLVSALNPTPLLGQLNKVGDKLVEFKAIISGIDGLSARIASDSANFVSPLTRAVAEAKHEVEQLKSVLPKTVIAAVHAQPGATAATNDTGHGKSTGATAASKAGGAKEEKHSSLADKIDGVVTAGQARWSLAQTIAGPFDKMVGESASFEKKLVRAQLDGALSKDDIAALYEALLAAREGTQLTPLDEAKILDVVGPLVGPDPSKIARFLPIFSNFADAQAVLTDTPPDQSAKNLGNFFRQFRIKDELPAWGYASQLDRLSMLIPGSVESFVTSVTSDPSREMQGKGYSIQDILLANVMAPRSGLSGDDAAKKLVESLSGAISAGTGNVNGKSGSALQELGLLDKDGRSPVMAGGHLDFLTFLQRLNAFETKVLGEVANPDEARRKIGSTFERAFGPADHIASGLARPDAIDATQKLATHPADPSLPTVQTAFDEGSVSRQFDVAKANLETTLIQVGKELLPTLIETLRLVNANISNLNGYLAQHPAAAKDIGLTTELGTGGLLGLLALSKFRTPLWRLATNPWAAGPLVAGGLAAAGIYGTTQQAQQFQKQLDKTGESDAVKGIMMSNRFSGDGVKSMPMDPIDLRGLWKKLQSLPPVDPGGFLPMSFTMPGDQRVPTMERAVALSKTDTPGKPSPLNVQVQPGKVVINLDGRTIATAVMEFMARQTGGPNTGPADFNSAGRLTPAGTQSGVYAT